MSLALLLAAVALFFIGGLAALLAGRSARWATLLGAASAAVASAAGLIGALRAVSGRVTEAISLPWDVPYGRFAVEVDPLSAFFLVVVLSLSALAAMYGAEYLLAYREKKSLGGAWFFFNLLAASMVLVVLARNGVLFLFAWELMALASFFLVTFHDEEESTRQAGWTYLVASHLSAAFLLVLFVLMGQGAGSLDFDAMEKNPLPPGETRNLLFLIALVGFGTKAGFIPFHVWLPEAHPAAPSHVSALMSGVMIKTGIYGLVRTLMLLGPAPASWGWTLVGLGCLSGVLGILFALAQHDLKRLLAYSSVENIGIITMGLGLGILGLTSDLPVVAVLGFGGALFHVLNHALFKSLLFLGAGAVAHAAGTRDMDRLGGLLKRMRWSGVAVLVGAVAICGLPPLNGFASELLIGLGAFQGEVSLRNVDATPAVAVIVSLAFIAGLSAACFAKAFGIVFLGEPRSDQAARAHEVGLAMRLPMLLLAGACVAVGLAGPLVLRGLEPVLEDVSGLPASTVRWGLDELTRPLTLVALTGLGFVGLLAALALCRRALLRGRAKRQTVTWDCGYAAPTSRMQYTGSSFSEPLTSPLGMVLRTRRRYLPPEGYFPRHAALETETPDRFGDGLYRPLFRAIAWTLAWVRWSQSGGVHVYILYIAVTLLLLLVWKIG